MTDNLKSCPFCGSATPVVAFTRIDAETGWWNAECHNCGAQHAPTNSEAEAIAAWNHRAAPTQDADLRAAVEREVVEWLRETAPQVGHEALADAIVSGQYRSPGHE